LTSINGEESKRGPSNSTYIKALQKFTQQKQNVHEGQTVSRFGKSNLDTS